MATETAVINIGVSLSNTSKKGGRASAVIQSGALQQPQAYSGGDGIIQSSNSAKNKLKMPHFSIEIGQTEDGQPVRMSHEWYRFLNELFEQRLGGTQGASIPDLSTTVVATRSQAIDAQTTAAAVGQQANANAQSLAATIQVSQNNNLSGASQIPRPVFSKFGNDLT